MKFRAGDTVVVSSGINDNAKYPAKCFVIESYSDRVTSVLVCFWNDKINRWNIMHIYENITHCRFVLTEKSKNNYLSKLAREYGLE